MIALKDGPALQDKMPASLVGQEPMQMKKPDSVKHVKRASFKTKKAQRSAHHVLLAPLPKTEVLVCAKSARL